LGSSPDSRDRRRLREPSDDSAIAGIPSLVGAPDPGLELHAEPVGYTIDECVIRRDLGDLQDVGIGEADLTKSLDVLPAHGGRGAGQLLGVVQHRPGSGLEARGVVVGLDPLGQGIILEQPTQPASVVGDSVVALVQDADD
jgi:hypothetical protein